VRVVCFSSIENELDDYLATHIRKEVMSHEEIAEAYRQRWAIEVLWKFLKMHLKLDKMMSKNLQSFPLLWGTVATFGKPICKRRRINQ